MTIKQRKWLKLYLETGNGTQSALKVYNCKSETTAATIASENIRKLNINDSIQAWCERLGATDRKLVGNLIEGTDANKSIAGVSGKDANEKTMDFIDVPDWQARAKFNELLLKIKGKLTEKKDITSGGEPIKFIVERTGDGNKSGFASDPT